MIKFLIILVFLIPLPIENLYCDERVKINLNSIPPHDREALAHLFAWLTQNDHFAYTLFGDKAVSVAGVWNKPRENFFQRNEQSVLFWKYWNIWEKYKNLFPAKNYLLIKEPSLSIANVSNIVFINKQAFKKQVNQHIEIFREKLESSLTSENLLEKIESSEKFASIIKNDELLWGILLGYGEHNASLFSRRKELASFICSDHFPSIPLKKPTPHPCFCTIEEEYAYLTSKLNAFEFNGFSLCLQGPLHFAADHTHRDTIALKEKYHTLRGKISKIYAKGDFLESVLSQLTESPPAP